MDPEYGPMACGGEGWGRLARLDEVVRRASETIQAAAPILPEPRLEESLK